MFAIMSKPHVLKIVKVGFQLSIGAWSIVHTEAYEPRQIVIAIATC